MSGFWQDRDQPGLAFRQSPGFVDDQGIDLGKTFERFGILDQHAGLGTASRCRHNRHGCCQAKRTRTGDDQHRDRRNQRIGQRRIGAPHRPSDEGKHRDQDHHRDKTPGNDIGEFLNRRAAALGGRDHLDDLAEHGVGTDPPGFDDQAAGSIDRGAGNGVADGFFDRNGFAGDHRFINRGAALHDFAIDRYLVAGKDSHAIADNDIFQRHFLFAAVGPDQARGLCGHIQQGTDRRSGTLARAKFHNLTEQHQNHDHGRRLKINADMTIGVAEAVREYPGCEHCGQTEQVSRPRSHRDQCEHV